MFKCNCTSTYTCLYCRSQKLKNCSRCNSDITSTKISCNNSKEDEKCVYNREVTYNDKVDSLQTQINKNKNEIVKLQEEVENNKDSECENYICEKLNEKANRRLEDICDENGDLCSIDDEAESKLVSEYASNLSKIACSTQVDLHFNTCEDLDNYQGTDACPLVNGLKATVGPDSDGCFDIYIGKWINGHINQVPDRCGNIINTGNGTVRYYQWKSYNECHKVTQEMFPSGARLFGLKVDGTKTINSYETPYDTKDDGVYITNYYKTVEHKEVFKASDYKKISESGNKYRVSFSMSVSLATNNDSSSVHNSTQENFIVRVTNASRIGDIEVDYPMLSSDDLKYYICNTHFDVLEGETNGQDIEIEVIHIVKETHKKADKDGTLDDVTWRLDATNVMCNFELLQ